MSKIAKAFAAIELIHKITLTFIFGLILYFLIPAIIRHPNQILMGIGVFILTVFIFLLVIGGAILTVFAICDWRDKYLEMKSKE